MADEAVTTQVKEDLYAPQSFSVDDILEEGGERESVEEVVEQEIEIEGGGIKVETETPSEVAELKKQVQEMQAELLNVSKKQTAKVEPDVPKTEKLSRSQLVAILREHKEDPEVLFNVAEYIAEQKALETRDATMKDVNYRTWSSNLSGMASRIISEDEDGYLAANPKVKGGLNEYATNLGLGDHPIGQLAAYAIFRLSDSVKAKGAIKSDVKSDKMEKVDPNKGKMDKTRPTTIRDKSQGLSADQLAVAKKFGVKPETYAKFVRRD
jgi:hypothetical protein